MDAKSQTKVGRAPRKVTRSTKPKSPGRQGATGLLLTHGVLTGGRTWCCVAAVALAGLTGCQNSSGLFAGKNNSIARLSPRSVPYLAGVAVPSGFQMAERLTDAYESGGVRFARQEYVGFADPHAIRDFYKEQMPLMGWRETSSHDIKGKLFLRFESNREECTVTIEPSVWFNRATIQAVVKPYNRNASEPPTRRPMP